MSASDTGEDAPLVQFFSLVRNSESPSAPASRTAATSNAESRCRPSARAAASSAIPSALASANRQSLDAQRRCIDAVTEFQIVGCSQRLEHLDQVAGDGHLAHRIGDLAVLDPEARGAPAVIAGDAVNTGADQVGDVKAL